MDDTTTFPDATRLEVIDENGRIYYAYFSAPGIEVPLQDKGKTLKIFATAGFVLGQ